MAGSCVRFGREVGEIEDDDDVEDDVEKRL